jgi:hypothetical protein
VIIVAARFGKGGAAMPDTAVGLREADPQDLACLAAGN